MSTAKTTPAGRYALIGEVDGQEIATGFWRSKQVADEALAAAEALAGLAGVKANLRLIVVDNAVLGNPKATAAELLTQLAPEPMKAHGRKAAAAAKKAAKATPAQGTDEVAS